MDLETQILDLLSENPKRDYTMVEVYEEINHVKLTHIGYEEYHEINLSVGTALSNLNQKGQD